MILSVAYVLIAVAVYLYFARAPHPEPRNPLEEWIKIALAVFWPFAVGAYLIHRAHDWKERR